MPPNSRGQQVIEGGIKPNLGAKMAIYSMSYYGVLNDSTLSVLSSNRVGFPNSTVVIEGSELINPATFEYSTVLGTSGLTPTDDGGFVVLAKDAKKLYVIKKDANNHRVWSTIIAVNTYSSTTGLSTGLDILPAPGGGYMVFSTYVLSGYLATLHVTKIDRDGRFLWDRHVLSPEVSNPIGVLGQGFTRVAATSDGSYVITGDNFSQLRRPYPLLAIAVKIDGQGNLLWRRTYDDVPLVYFSDLIANPYEGGTMLALGGTTFSGTMNGPTFPYKMQANGDLVKLGLTPFSGQSRIGSDGSGQPQYVVLESDPQDGREFKLTGLNQLNERVWTKKLGFFPVNNYDAKSSLLTTGDGYLVSGTTTSLTGKGYATRIVNLIKMTNPLALATPDYNCTTGAFTFKTTGGDDSPIDYFAAGITGWTSNPNQFVDRESRTVSDVQPFQLMARQNGQVVTLIWNLKAACGRSRVGVGEPTAGLRVRVLGNPVVSQTAELEITGVLDQAVQYNLVDGQGRILHQRSIERAENLERVSIPIGQTAGLYLFQVHTTNEQQTVKLIKR